MKRAKIILLISMILVGCAPTKSIRNQESTPPVSAPPPETGGPTAPPPAAPGTSCSQGPCANEIPQTFITSRWSSPVANGWFPRLSSDGRYVAHGFGAMYVADLQTGETRDVDPGRAFYGRWIRPGVLTYLREASDNLQQRIEVNIADWVPRATPDDPNIASGNQFEADSGNWASFSAGNPLRMAWNNQVVATGIGGALSVSGDLMAHATTNDNRSITLRSGGVVIDQFPALTPLHQMHLANGYISYGGYGPIYGITPVGQQYDLTVASWRWEANMQVFFVNGQQWLASFSYNDRMGRGFILLRPWTDKNAIIIHADAASLHVVSDGSIIKVAYNNDRGALTVLTLPASAPRYLVLEP